MKKIRLDQIVLDRGLASSREKAKSSIMAGQVFINGQRMDKPGMSVPEDANVELKGKALPYVSRGGLKLEKALETFQISPAGMVCLDCGASTGGFTDVLLKNGAKLVYAVDVGYGQLAWSLRCDERVVVMERTNIRYVTPDMLTALPELVVIDLSFISIRLVLPVIWNLTKDEASVICLIKPQFEAGKEKVGKKGVVRDKETHFQVLESFRDFARGSGFSILAFCYSPLKGPEGNIEYLSLLKKGGHETANPDIRALVDAAHCELDS